MYVCICLVWFALSGPDVIRGMMRFSTGVELGARGWEWLQIHLANLHGGCKKYVLYIYDNEVTHLDTLLLENASHALCCKSLVSLQVLCITAAQSDFSEFHFP